jgi:hypothetical protein
MALVHIPLEQINESHLQSLISAQAAETLYVDYKRETYGGSDEQRREFLADVSSFANAGGGDLIVGMTESEGIPTGFHQFAMNADAERLRLEQMARDGLQPRIMGLQTRAVPLAAGGWVIVVRVPKSYNPPHRLIFKNSLRFWARSSAGKFEPNVEELRHIFTAAPQLAERIRSFRMERIAKVSARETPVPVFGGCPLLAMHVVPYSAFDMRRSLSLAEVEKRWQQFAPLGSDSPTYWGVNFDGFLGLSNADAKAPQQRAYIQVFRSGSVEAVAAVIDGVLKTIELEAVIVRYAGLYADGLHACGIDPPLVVLASLLGTERSSFVAGNEGIAANGIRADRDQYHFVEAVLENIPKNDRKAAPALRFILDHLAGLAGKSQTPTFDSAGNYLLKI